LQITFLKTSDRTLETTALRDDGVTVQLRGSWRQSELPHDLGHYVVESELGLAHGFWGCIGDGALFPGVTVVPGKQSPRANPRAQALVRAVYQERGASELLLRAFQAATRIEDPARRFAELVSQEVRRWFPAAAKVDKDTRRRIVERLLILEDRWQGLAVGESLTFFWPFRGARTRPWKRSGGGVRRGR
jgi:hypothetical protein